MLKKEAALKDFRDLKVREKSHSLSLLVYKHTQPFPKQEMFGLTSQMCRAAIPANIAEGCGRGGNSGFLNRIDYKELELATTEVKRMLASLIAKINAEHRKV